MTAPALTAALLCALMLAVAADPFLRPANFRVISGRFYGKATNYGGPFDGMNPQSASFGLSIGGCGLGNLNNPATYPYRRAAAWDPAAQAVRGLPSFGCGSCWKITSTSSWKSVVVMNTDVCPGCQARNGNPNHIDIHYSTWTLLQTPSKDGGGVFPMIAERVSCNPGSPMEIKIKDFQGRFSWLRLFPFKVAGKGTVKAVQVYCPNSITFGGKKETNWQKLVTPLRNTYGAVWEASKIPLYASGSACSIIAQSEDGAAISSSWIKLDAFIGKGLGGGNGVPVSLGNNFWAGRRRSLVQAVNASASSVLDDVPEELAEDMRWSWGLLRELQHVNFTEAELNAVADSLAADGDAEAQDWDGDGQVFDFEGSEEEKAAILAEWQAAMSGFDAPAQQGNGTEAGGARRLLRAEQ